MQNFVNKMDKLQSSWKLISATGEKTATYVNTTCLAHRMNKIAALYL